MMRNIFSSYRATPLHLAYLYNAQYWT